MSLAAGFEMKKEVEGLSRGATEVEAEKNGGEDDNMCRYVTHVGGLEGVT